jgi:uncharacterized protein YdaU (DUF1376 family)
VDLHASGKAGARALRACWTDVFAEQKGRVVNYYPFHLGDYAAHTGHLEPMEDLAYRRLVDVYYMREGPLPADIQATAKLVRMRSCADDVESVLREFFVLTDAGWSHKRCNEEIEKMQSKQAQAREAAQRSVNARKAAAERALAKQATGVERTLVVSPTDVQLPTPTPTPTPTPIEEQKKEHTDPGGPLLGFESDPVKEIFDLGVNILTRAGHPERSARTLVGRLRKLKTDTEAAAILVAAKATTDPAAYIVAACTPKTREVAY